MGAYLRSLAPGRDDYRNVRNSWRGDVLAGVTVGVVALPLALGFGVSSGAGAEAGLITAIVAGIVAAVFGGSNVQVSGPTGAMVVVLGPIVALHGLGAVAVVSLGAGVIVLAAGLAKLGRTVSVIPWPVIEGFTLGIATVIFLQQVPSALGVAQNTGGNAAFGAVQAIFGSSVPVAVWSLVAVATVAALMVTLPMINRLLPASLIAIVVVTFVAVVAHLPLATIGALPATLPAPRLPAFDLPTLVSLGGPMLTVAALAAIESLLSARVAASISDTGSYDADRELVGQGLASIASGLFGGMPATGAIARTAVNLRAGARTRLAAVVHAIVLLLVVFAGSSVVAQIPLAALAGVLLVTAVRMVSRATVRSVLTSSRADAAVFVTTAVVTVAFDLIVAVGIGIAFAGVMALRTMAKSGGVHRELLPAPAAAGDERIALFRLDGALFFGAADRMLDHVAEIRDVSVVIIRMSQLEVLDATGARALSELARGLERRGIVVLLKGIRPAHLALAARVGVIAALGHAAHTFDELDAAVDHARDHVRSLGGGSQHRERMACEEP